MSSHDGGHGERVLDGVADAVAAQPQEVQQAAAGDVGQPVDVEAGAQERERRADVDHGRLEQRVGDARAAQLGRAVVEAESAVLEQRAARERVAVGVQARRGDADERVARRHVGAGQDRVEGDRADGRPAQVEAVRGRVAADELGQDGELAAGISIPAASAPTLQALADALERIGVGLLDGEVVDHRDRLGADADQVVDVHRDAVDADRLEPPRLLGDDELGADAVGRQGDAELRRHAEHRGVVAGQRHGGRGPAGLDRPQDRHERPDGAVGRARVDAGGGVGVAHRRPFCRRTGGAPGPRPARRGRPRRARAGGRRRAGAPARPPAWRRRRPRCRPRRPGGPAPAGPAGPGGRPSARSRRR